MNERKIKSATVRPILQDESDVMASLFLFIMFVGSSKLEKFIG